MVCCHISSCKKEQDNKINSLNKQLSISFFIAPKADQAVSSTLAKIITNYFIPPIRIYILIQHLLSLYAG
jgi:hypothetical protein